MRLIIGVVSLGMIAFTPAFAQDATCAKLKNATHRGVCNCHVSHGGWVRAEANGRIAWGAYGGGGNIALQNCRARYQ